MSVNVKLIAETNVAPGILASHAAKTCYEPEIPELGKLIDVKGRLFDTGHHTTIQHSNFTFAIDGISVSSVCFGLHLASPYYNTDQRSGRFSKMYDNPDMGAVKQHLKEYFPEQDLAAASDFIKKGLDIYAGHKDFVTQIAIENIKQERPFASEKYINANAPKLAQEQLRMFIPMVAPTALDYSINLSALAALHRTTWNPEMREVVAKMVYVVVEKYPEISYMFQDAKKSSKDWSPRLDCNDSQLKEKPVLRLLDIRYDDDGFAPVDMKDMVDASYFSPEYMNNTQQHVMTDVEISCATMGQDQRHRSIKRGSPAFTGNFYLPPLLKKAGLAKKAADFNKHFIALRLQMPPALWTMIAPYGAMVRYTKVADLNALLHEQEKRTCWCAQEEIYHLGTGLRESLINEIGADSKLVKSLAPHCFKYGKCCEGLRFCGRDITERLTERYFRDRQI
ncbi:MAG: FAD-dependent thymidylate synthase [Rickettsiales bacterium]|nr:FAD-dependent thymidylate synthase [Rickettsiales bacterium]